MSTKKTPLKTLLFSIPVLLVTVLFPWDNDNSIKSTEKYASDQAATTTTNIQYAELKNFPVLRISKDSISDLFAKTGGKKVRKLVFKFQIDSAETLNPSLNVFRAQNKKRKYIGRETVITMDRVKDLACEITGKYTMGNLELKRKNDDGQDWESILGKADSTDTYLYFYPDTTSRDGAYRIIYSLFWGTATAPYTCDERKRLLPPPDGGLNPSPPADPK